jgi:hypothetical protein
MSGCKSRCRFYRIEWDAEDEQAQVELIGWRWSANPCSWQLRNGFARPRTSPALLMPASSKRRAAEAARKIWSWSRMPIAAHRRDRHASDAQNATLVAYEAATNAVYGFLIDLMQVERAIGQFYFFRRSKRRKRTSSGWRVLSQGGRSFVVVPHGRSLRRRMYKLNDALVSIEASPKFSSSMPKGTTTNECMKI